MRFLYPFFIQLYYAALLLASLWNKKARKWISGRKTLWVDLDETLRQAQDKHFSKPHAVIWIHSASAGEFEQAKPVIEALKKKYPQYKILVTFFSPSGIPAGMKFSLADFVIYLPLDTKKNAARFVKIVQPKLVVFVKYDYWYQHLKAVHDRKIPLLLISALFRTDQVFFRWYGAFFRNILSLFTQLLVQDETSYGLLKKFGIAHCTIAGDTRFDRVITIAENIQNNPLLEMEPPIGPKFLQDKKIIVAGSTWPEDEKRLHGVLKKFANVKLIIAPHEIGDAHIQAIQALFPNAFKYSDLEKAFAVEWVVLNNEPLWKGKTDAETVALQQKYYNADVLIIDAMGLLSKLYNYATITYIGGGFKKSGIHNTLEAAVFGKPVLFGPNYQKFREARELLSCGAAFSFQTETELESRIRSLLADENALQKSSQAAFEYVQGNGGATQKIMRYIQENRLLTN